MALSYMYSTPRGRWAWLANYSAARTAKRSCRARARSTRESASNASRAKRRAAWCLWERARANKLRLDWASYSPPRPTFLGTRVLAPFPLEELRSRIDWTPFFQTWELKGKYPAILNDGVVGPQARSLFEDAEQMLDRIIAENWLEARAVVGFFPAASADDDIEVYDESRNDVRARLHFVRQQMNRRGGDQSNLCLADFVAPRGDGRGLHRRLRGHRGARHRRARCSVRSVARRLQLHPTQGARRPAG